MGIGQPEIITAKTSEDKQNVMRQFCYLCKLKLLFCCKECNKLLFTNSLIEKIIRLKTGKICFIIGDEDEKSEIMEKFAENIIIKPVLKVNDISDFQTVGINEVSCKSCKSSLGVKMKQTDDTQMFMLNKFVLKHDAMKYFCLQDLGIRPFDFSFKRETLKNLDKTAFETEEYINQSGHQIQKFFDLLGMQAKDFKEIETKKNDIEKLGDILKYLIDKNYI